MSFNIEDVHTIYLKNDSSYTKDEEELDKHGTKRQDSRHQDTKGRDKYNHIKHALMKLNS